MVVLSATLFNLYVLLAFFSIFTYAVFKFVVTFVSVLGTKEKTGSGREAY